MNGKKHSEDEIGELQCDNVKWKQFSDHQQKWVKLFPTIVANMKQWWVSECKTNASEGKEPGQGVLDAHGRTLFSKPATKSAYENNLVSAEGLPDVLSKADLCLAVEPSKRSKSKLTRWVGQRGVESKLEKAHHAIANYANGGMRNSLADNLSLSGIALCNLSIRERI
jgi:hypothetical protein